jgi:hypothetical protein
MSVYVLVFVETRTKLFKVLRINVKIIVWPEIQAVLVLGPEFVDGKKQFRVCFSQYVLSN